MRKVNLENSKYAKTFFSFTIIVLLSSIILSAALSISFDQFASDIVQSYSVEELSQISFSTNFMFENAKSILLQYYNNPSALKLMNYDNLSNLEVADLLTKANELSINLPSDNSILIYNEKANRIYDNGEYTINEYFDQNIVKLLKSGSGVRKLYPISRKIKNKLNQEEDVYTFVMYDGSSNEISSAVILNMSQKWLKDTIKSMNSQANDEIIIVDSDGTIVLGNDNYKYLTNLKDEAIFSDISISSSDSGRLTKDVNSKKYLISYVSSNALKWKFIRITPYKLVSDKYSKARITIFVIAAIITLLSLLVALFFSNKVYLIFKRNIKEIEKKYQAEKNSSYDKKQNFLKKILEKGSDTVKSGSKLNQYGIDFNLTESFLFVLFKPDQYHKYCSNYSPEDRELFSYGFINIINELAEPFFRHEAVDIGQGYIGAVFNMKNNDYQDTTIKIEQLVTLIQEKIAEYLNISFSSVIGDVLEEFSEICSSVEQCKDAMKYRIFYGEKSIIYVSSIRELQKKNYQIPLQSINNLVDNLMLGKGDEVKKIYGQIIEGTKGYSFTNLQMTVFQLSISIKSALEKQSALLEKIRNDHNTGLEVNSDEYETFDMIYDNFFAYFKEIIKEIDILRNDENKLTRYDKLISEVNEFLEKEYQNPNLNPDMIATHFGITSEYLRRLYKKTSGCSLGEYMTHFRLCKACELLENIDEPISEIALKTGFVNINYFYAIFKKSYRITPSEFRNLKTQNK